MGGGYEQVGSPSDSPNINPMTGGMMSGAQGQQAQLWSMLSGMTPEALMQGLSGQMGNIQGMTSQLTAPWAQQVRQAGMAQSSLDRMRTQGALSMEGGYGAVGSGPGQGATELAAMLPMLNAEMQIGQQGLGMASQFANAYTGAAGQRAGLLGNMWGANQQGMFGMAAPEWYEPAYGYQPGFWDYATSILGGAAGGAGAFGMSKLLGGGGGAAAAAAAV